jgi:hypothetical protein
LALAYCNDCRRSHVPGDHRASRSESRPGGRHLASKKSRPTNRTKTATPRRETTARVDRPVVATKPERPTAEQLGTQTANFIRRIGKRGKTALDQFLLSCRVWGTEARKGFTEIVDLTSVIPDGSQPVRHRRIQTAEKTYATAAQPESSNAPVSASSVAVIEHSPLSRQHLLEVSVLESLGFYDPESAIAVTVSDTTQVSSTGHMVLNAPAPPPSSEVKPDHRRSLIPDIDLSNWKPHVIARSKLGQGRISSTTIVVLSLTLVVLVAMVAGLLRAPGRQAVQEGRQVTDQVAELTAALTGLDPVLADATTDVAEATPLLIAVDSSARNLFDAASELGDDPEQAILRQSATSVAQRALDFETLVGDSLSYRLVLNPLWRSPELQGLIDPTQAAAAIATWQAQLGDMIEALPVSAELSTHVEQVRAFVNGLEDWRIDYMDALAVEDLAEAEAAVADLEGQLALLAQSGEETLTAIFADAGSERRRLLADLASIAS